MNAATAGTGSITFQELVSGIMPSDFGEDTWVEHADRRADAEEERRNATREPILQSWPSSLSKNRMSQDELLAVMRRKIIERTKRYGRRYLLCCSRCTLSPPDPSHTIMCKPVDSQA